MAIVWPAPLSVEEYAAEGLLHATLDEDGCDVHCGQGDGCRSYDLND